MQATPGMRTFMPGDVPKCWIKNISDYCRLPGIAYELQPFIVSYVGNIFVIECADSLFKRRESLLFEPAGEEVEHLPDNSFPVEIKGRT